MEFESKVQFLGIEEKNVSEGQLFLVRCYSGNEVVEFYVNGKNPFIYSFIDAKFGDEINCLFAIIPHPKYNGAFKLKFKSIV